MERLALRRHPEKGFGDGWRGGRIRSLRRRARRGSLMEGNSSASGRHSRTARLTKNPPSYRERCVLLTRPRRFVRLLPGDAKRLGNLDFRSIRGNENEPSIPDRHGDVTPFVVSGARHRGSCDSRPFIGSSLLHDDTSFLKTRTDAFASCHSKLRCFESCASYSIEKTLSSHPKKRDLPIRTLFHSHLPSKRDASGNRAVGR